ncbi:MAG TPA: GGDEF domain-containing protein [bacterium]|nr:GGDEF domain-containing protein [bacterium]HND76740.1 GGDEF domain-containing protein [bacterium]HNE84671.1 GGDEF domain-containing protein [bacterium]HNH27839.1 GGDEF domain-containing protein [bacterium]HNH31547.1 GGDEF domain-containing protein [bacterium]
MRRKSSPSASISTQKSMKNRPTNTEPSPTQMDASETLLIEELKSKVSELEASYIRVQDENQLLHKRLHQTSLLYKIAAMLNSTYDTTKLYNIIQNMLSDISFVRHYALIERTDSGSVNVLFHTHTKDRSLAHVLDAEKEVAEKVFSTEKESYVISVNERKDLLKYFPMKTEGSIVALPLTFHKKSSKVVCYFAEHSLSDGEKEFLNLITNEIGVAVERALLYQETFEISIKDGLTGIYNRRYFNDRSQREFNRAKRYKHILSFILMDIDHFKKFNDTYGHKVGDEVLVWVAKNLGKGLRDHDVLARYGGEEFIVILPETDVKGAAIVAEKLRKIIDEQSVQINHLFVSQNPHSTFHTDRVTISLGVASFPKDGATLEEVLERTDQQLYVAKSQGRNQVGYEE